MNKENAKRFLSDTLEATLECLANDDNAHEHLDTLKKAIYSYEQVVPKGMDWGENTERFMKSKFRGRKFRWRKNKKL